MLTTKSRMVNKIRAHSPISFNHISFQCPIYSWMLIISLKHLPDFPFPTTSSQPSPTTYFIFSIPTSSIELLTSLSPQKPILSTSIFRFSRSIIPTYLLQWWICFLHRSKYTTGLFCSKCRLTSIWNREPSNICIRTTSNTRHSGFKVWGQSPTTEQVWLRVGLH